MAIVSFDYTYGQDYLLLGTRSGTLHALDVTLSLLSPVTLSYADVVGRAAVQGHAPALEVLRINPVCPSVVLLGYAEPAKVLVAWDLGARRLARTYILLGLAHVTAACWYFKGDRFATAHADGTVSLWKYSAPKKPVSSFPLLAVGQATRVLDLAWTKLGERGMMFARCADDDGDTLVLLEGSMKAPQKLERVAPFERRAAGFDIMTDSPYSSQRDPYSIVVVHEDGSLVLRSAKHGHATVALQSAPFILSGAAVTCHAVYEGVRVHDNAAQESAENAPQQQQPQEAATPAAAPEKEPPQQQQQPAEASAQPEPAEKKQAAAAAAPAAPVAPVLDDLLITGEGAVCLVELCAPRGLLVAAQRTGATTIFEYCSRSRTLCCKTVSLAPAEPKATPVAAAAAEAPKENAAEQAAAPVQKAEEPQAAVKKQEKPAEKAPEAPSCAEVGPGWQAVLEVATTGPVTAIGVDAWGSARSVALCVADRTCSLLLVDAAQGLVRDARCPLLATSVLFCAPLRRLFVGTSDGAVISADASLAAQQLAWQQSSPQGWANGVGVVSLLALDADAQPVGPAPTASGEYFVLCARETDVALLEWEPAAAALSELRRTTLKTSWPVAHACVFGAADSRAVAAVDEETRVHVLRLMDLSSVASVPLTDELLPPADPAAPRPVIVPAAARAAPSGRVYYVGRPVPGGPCHVNIWALLDDDKARVDELKADETLAQNVPPPAKPSLMQKLSLSELPAPSDLRLLFHAPVPGSQRPQLAGDDEEGKRRALMGDAAPAAAADKEKKPKDRAEELAAANDGARGQMQRNLDLMKQRGEHLLRIEDKSDELAAHASDFASLCRQLSEQEKNKKWYQL
eukprot:m51a1_g12579 hypothetical protein (856) ;mRNA; r:535-3948